MSNIIDELANRFLMWRLPDTVCADQCATDREYAQRFPGTRCGTNLLTLDEARQMVEYVFADALKAAMREGEIKQDGDAAPLPQKEETGGGLVRFKMTPPEGWKYAIGERVQKKKGSDWRGFVCGYYWSSLTKRGVCVESAFERGSVQIYPEHALGPWDR